MTRWASASTAVCALLLGGCAVAAEVRTSQPGASAVRELSPAQAASVLDGLPRTDRDPSLPAYERDAFGTAWADTDGNGCNQRDDVLLRDAVPGSTTVQRQGACDHDVLAGAWVDPYTGVRFALDDLKDPAQAQTVQIDHVVALAEAWRSGASGWSESRRVAFANDLGALAATYGPTNASKSDGDPAAWRPPQAFQCGYALRWLAVKEAWDLAVDPSEATALEEMLDRCTRGG